MATPTPTMDDLLAHQTFTHLTPAQVTQFMTHGWVVIEGAIPLDKCDSWTANLWPRLGMDPNDKSTWSTDPRERIHMAKHNYTPCSTIAPKAWNAMCELLGGAERIATGKASGDVWCDSFIVNLGTEAGEGVVKKPKELTNWHVDGDFFVHFLDSPEQALLVIPCWSDVVSEGGATMICEEGPRRIGKILYENPQGVNPAMGPRDVVPNYGEKASFKQEVLKADDSSFVEMTGRKGDVILMHPLMLHSATNNAKRVARIITNPPVSLKEPFNFNRSDPSQYSLVELKTIQDCGGPEKFKDWKITAPREMVIPERMKLQNTQLATENANLKARGMKTTDESLSQLPITMVAKETTQQQPRQTVVAV